MATLGRRSLKKLSAIEYLEEVVGDGDPNPDPIPIPNPSPHLEEVVGDADHRGRLAAAGGVHLVRGGGRARGRVRVRGR
eukprot:scaffold30388_cov21-Phaeocystis_antarctica.AAC.1